MDNHFDIIVWEYINHPEKRVAIIASLSSDEKIRLKKVLDNISSNDLHDSPNLLQIKNKILKQKHKHTSTTFKHFAKYAAVVALVITAYFVANNYMTNNLPETELVAQSIEDGDGIVKLILDDGKVVELEKNFERIISKSNLVINNNKTVTYELISKKQQPQKFHTIVVPKKATYKVVLTDGTEVFLNSESKLTYPTAFSSKTRTVQLEGEALFNVTKSQHKKFIVKVGQVDVQVLGTVFNVNAYKERKQIVTTLVEGKVAVTAKHNKLNLQPNEQAIFTNDTFSKKNVDAQRFASWVNGVFYFDGMTLANMMHQVERWFDIQITFKDKSLTNKTFRGVIKKDQSLGLIFNIIENTAKVKVEKKGGLYFIDKI